MYNIKKFLKYIQIENTFFKKVYKDITFGVRRFVNREIAYTEENALNFCGTVLK